MGWPQIRAVCQFVICNIFLESYHFNCHNNYRPHDMPTNKCPIWCKYLGLSGLILNTCWVIVFLRIYFQIFVTVATRVFLSQISLAQLNRPTPKTPHRAYIVRRRLRSAATSTLIVPSINNFLTCVQFSKLPELKTSNVVLNFTCGSRMERRTNNFSEQGRSLRHATI